jgi:hypothetical protein
MFDSEMWIEHARRSFDSALAIWKSSMEYGAEMAAQWRKLTFEMFKK